MIRRTLLLTGVIASVSALAQQSAQAQSVEEFYRGKTLNMIIGYPAAGANDRYARTLARHITKYIPGNPKVISRNIRRCAPSLRFRL